MTTTRFLAMFGLVFLSTVFGSEAGDVPRVLSGIGIAILSTPKGVMTGAQAKRLGVGGEVLCYVY